MRRVRVRASREYDVAISRGIIDDCGSIIAAATKSRSVVLVSDSNVAPLYADRAERSLSGAGFSVSRVVFEAGEKSKNLRTLSDILEEMARCGATRSSIIAALGGGVVGDVAGFAASVYMRGIDFAQIPTTLLAMIDSSVGGKTAVDLDGGKNLCGAFHQPIAVVCDLDAMSTLTPDILADGLGEAVKYGMGFDASLLDLLSSEERDYEAIVARCVEIKAAVVEADEHDTGERQKLNLGHTAAHAMERLADFSISHGKAVAVGMLIVSRAAAKRGLLSKDDLAVLERAIDSLALPKDCRWSARELADAAMSDKKRRGGTVALVVPTAVGSCDIIPTPTDELEKFFDDGLR